MRSIATNLETDKLIEDIKKKDLDFNLSEFVRIALQQKEQIGDKLDEDVILRNLKDAKDSISKGQNNLEFWEGKQKQLYVQQEMMKSKAQEEIEKEERKKERLIEQRKNIEEAFGEVTGRKITQSEYEEYTNLSKGSIWSFAKSKIDENKLEEAPEEKPLNDEEVERLLIR